ncbi:MAG: thiamine pyrophosphate-dependent enzyme [Rhodospirillales bacterium]
MSTKPSGRSADLANNSAKPANTITGSSAFLALMHGEGVTAMFGNPGTTELPIMDALTKQADIDYVLGLQESIVIAMADGFARASGQLAACNVHVAPGLGNAIGAIYTANLSGTPMIITAGQQEQGHGLTEPALYAPLVPIAAPVVKWAIEVTRIEDMPRILHRAAKIAQTAPTGPVFISLPGDILNDEAALDLGETTQVDTRSRPNDAALDALARRLLVAKNPMILAGTEVVSSNALGEAARLAEILGCAVYQQSMPHGAHFPSEHPAFMGALTRSQPQVRQMLSPYDLMICLGAEVLTMSVYSPVDPLPADTKLVQIGLRDWEMGKNWSADLAVRADVKETLQSLNPLLEKIGGAERAARAKAVLAALADKNWSAQREAKRQVALAKAAQTPIAPEWLMMRLAESLPRDAIVVDEGLTTTASLLSFYPFCDRYSYFGNVSGGIGWGIAAAVGIQKAQPKRRVVAVIGDGSAMYSVQSLWSAAHYKLPVTYIIANNGGYRIIKQRLKSFHGNETAIGMDFRDPPIDMTALAGALGVRAERVATGAQFDAALKTSLAGNVPTVIEVMVDGTV